MKTEKNKSQNELSKGMFPEKMVGLNVALLNNPTKDRVINIKEVDIMKGVYLDFDNGPVVLLKENDSDVITLVGLDNSYRGEHLTLEEILKRHNNIDVAKTFRGEKIIF